MFTDQSSNKIYLPLLEKFANGINAREIMKGEAIDDITGMAVKMANSPHQHLRNMKLILDQLFSQL